MIGKKFFLNAREGSFSEIQEPGQPRNVFTEITGHLVRVTFKETKAGEALRLYVVSELNFYVISMFVRSRIATAFMLMAKNINLMQPMKFRMERKDLKDCLNIHQDGSSIRWYYTQENAHELPTMPDDKRAFLRKIIEEEVIPTLQKKLNPYPNHAIYKEFGSGKGLQGGYFDDFASSGKPMAPVSRYEKQIQKVYGNNRPL
jgi:hypothetical protein